MYQWPIDLSLDGSSQKMTNHCEEIIEQLEETSSAGGNIIRIVPTFEMSNETGLKKLKPYGKKLFIDDESYIKFELHRRVVYISKDSPDKRPFIYWGGVEPFNGANGKAYLENLVIGAIQDPRTKVVYRDNDLCNLKMSNITFEAKNNISSPPKKDVVVEILEDVPNKPTIGEPIISTEEKEALQDAIFNNPPKVEINEKVQAVMDNIDSKRGLTPLEHQYLKKGEIDSEDAHNLRFSWLGISKYETKRGERYSVTLKGVTIKSGFAHPLDAARCYNDFIIKHGLPYPVNNIPGFLELQIREYGKYNVLGDYETWQLSEEITKRVKPEQEKF